MFKGALFIINENVKLLPSLIHTRRYMLKYTHRMEYYTTYI